MSIKDLLAGTPEDIASRLYDKPVVEKPEELPPWMFNDQDRQSGTWKKFYSYLEDRKHILRCMNDNPGLGTVETSAIRGKISLITELQQLGNELVAAPKDVGPDPGY